MSTITARDFNHDVSAAKRAANEGPVIITDRGEPAYVLLTIADYLRLEEAGSSPVDRLNETGASLVDALSMDEDIDVEFEPAQSSNHRRI